MAVRFSTTPIPTISLCLPLPPSSSSTAGLPFLRRQTRQRSPVSMTRAGDSSSSSSSSFSCRPTGLCIRIFPLAFIIPSFSPVRFDAYLRMLSVEGMLRCSSHDWAPVDAVIANVSYMIDVISLNIFVFLMAGTLNDGGLKIASPGVIGQNDLLIVGPGVLGRTVAEKWHKVG
ncbi:hypothetical protein B296_00019993 [Ensete ventricosum]|uniref:Uncharacterized protein n=1 Tax=Ensete ventricosum TaxID=4639 RepID=A0A427A0I1_ENSVE|nr:hypothetical protein B296_00019993 [Ensete ventricosum]